ncbi:MAG TPA: hypothetical protein VE464_02135 [Streptosporangiaceae bacterium]|nr:hypothetical protein [Streptosporangiaceae bacterium]
MTIQPPAGVRTRARAASVPVPPSSARARGRKTRTGAVSGSQLIKPAVSGPVGHLDGVVGRQQHETGVTVVDGSAVRGRAEKGGSLEAVRQEPGERRYELHLTGREMRATRLAEQRQCLHVPVLPERAARSSSSKPLGRRSSLAGGCSRARPRWTTHEQVVLWMSADRRIDHLIVVSSQRWMSADLNEITETAPTVNDL